MVQPHKDIRFSKTKMRVWRNLPDKIRATAERLSGVFLESRDASYLVDRFRQAPKALVYCDPPYQQGGHLYGPGLDRRVMLELLADKATRAKIAVSGYPGDTWEMLSQECGWYRHTLETFERQSGKNNVRTEVLWTNYQLAQTLFDV